MQLHKRTKVLTTLGVLLPLAGCAGATAPSFVIAGAYFPGWMICGLTGILCAIGARIAMVMSGLSAQVPFPLFVCLAAGLLMAEALWLVWFGR